MRSQVKWKVTVERSSEKQKFAKLEKWQDGAEWKVKSQVTGADEMKACSVFAERVRTLKRLGTDTHRVKGAQSWNPQLTAKCHLLLHTSLLLIDKEMYHCTEWKSLFPLIILKGFFYSNCSKYTWWKNLKLE